MPPTSWNDLNEDQLRQMAETYVGGSTEDLDRDDLVELLNDEGVSPGEALVSDAPPELPPLSQGSEIRRRGPVVAPDLPELDAHTALGVRPRSAMPPSPGDSYPVREPEPSPDDHPRF